MHHEPAVLDRPIDAGTVFGRRAFQLVQERRGSQRSKGYGFIRPADGGLDVFVHISAVEKAGYTSLAEGARISYELVTGRSGKASAENLRLG